MIGYACAECGTTEATTFVVTQLDPDDDSTRTEVCRHCDDLIRDLRVEIKEELHKPTVAKIWREGRLVFHGRTL